MIFLSKIENLPILLNKVLYFYSSNLEYNKKFLKMISKIEKNNKNYIFFALNIDSDLTLKKRFDLKSVPCIIIFNNKKIKKCEGMIDFKKFKKFFSNII